MKRTLFALVLSLVFVAALAPSVHASIGRAAREAPPIPANANTICNNPTYVMKANSGWYAEGTYQVATQLFALVDGNNGAYCDYAYSNVGIQFLSTGQTCADMLGYLWAEERYNGHWDNVAEISPNPLDVCGVHLQTFWRNTPATSLPVAVYCKLDGKGVDQWTQYTQQEYWQIITC